MSLIKKIVSVFGKKDAPKKKEAVKTKSPSTSTPKKQSVKPHQEEWRPGQKRTPRKPRPEGQKSGPPQKQKSATAPSAPQEGAPQGERKAAPPKAAGRT